jgi:hypothetical protein
MGKIDERRLSSWWVERGIPDSREGIQAALRELGVSDQTELLIGYHGLSLTDHYWIDDMNGGRKWKDVNFYENDFDLDIGELFFNKKKGNRVYSGKSPDVVSNGNLRKRWIVGNDGKRYLIKGGKKPYIQEPCNEVIASELCRRLEIPHVPYSLVTIDGEKASKCINMTNANIEFVDAISVFNTKEQTAFADNFYDQYCSCAKQLNVKNIEAMLDRMMVLDYLLLNHDRHFRNFGILRNSERLADAWMAPLFDSGTSLYCDEGLGGIVYPEKRKPIRTYCFTDLTKQLNLVKDWTWYNRIKLVGMDEVCMDVFSKVPHVEKERGKAIAAIMNIRIQEIERYIDTHIYTDKRNRGRK